MSALMMITMRCTFVQLSCSRSSGHKHCKLAFKMPRPTISRPARIWAWYLLRLESGEAGEKTEEQRQGVVKVKVKAVARLVMERARFSLGRQTPARREGPHSWVWLNDHFRAASLQKVRLLPALRSSQLR